MSAGRRMDRRVDHSESKRDRGIQCPTMKNRGVAAAIQKLSLLLVTLSLKQLALLVLAHLLSALLNHTTQRFSPRPTVRSSQVRRHYRCGITQSWGAVSFRDSLPTCQAMTCLCGINPFGWSTPPRAQYQPQRGLKPFKTKFRAVPSARFTGWRRGRKDTIGDLRFPSAPIDSRITA